MTAGAGRIGLWVALGLMTASLGARQLQTPADWRWRTDVPAKVTNTGNAGDDVMVYVAMPPGWHITTGPGVALFQPSYTGRGNFTLESQVFLFPGDSQEEYGLFIGGKGLDPASASASYLAFVGRRDGQAAVLRHAGGKVEPIVAWKTNDAVVPHPGGTDTAKNVFRVEVAPTEIIFGANGKEIARVPRAGLDTDGQFGFRVGKGMNLHVSTLDATYRLAPIPVKK